MLACRGPRQGGRERRNIRSDDVGSLETQCAADQALGSAQTADPAALKAPEAVAQGSGFEHTELADSAQEVGGIRLQEHGAGLLTVAKKYYKIECELARGGMGRISGAEDLPRDWKALRSRIERTLDQHSRLPEGG